MFTLSSKILFPSEKKKKKSVGFSARNGYLELYNVNPTSKSVTLQELLVVKNSCFSFLFVVLGFFAVVFFF